MVASSGGGGGGGVGPAASYPAPRAAAPMGGGGGGGGGLMGDLASAMARRRSSGADSAPPGGGRPGVGGPTPLPQTVPMPSFGRAGPPSMPAPMPGRGMPPGRPGIGGLPIPGKVWYFIFIFHMFFLSRVPVVNAWGAEHWAVRVPADKSASGRSVTF